jgi:LysM repeat protein
MEHGPTAVAEGEAPRESDTAATPGTLEAAKVRASRAPSPTVESVCPFLIAATGDWRLAAPTRDHRCAAFVPLTSLSLEKQARLCLTGEHGTCATYQASVTARALQGGSGEPVDRVGRWGFARTTPLIEDTGGLRGTLITMIGDRRTWPAIPAVLLVATLIAVGISGIRGEGPAVAVATPSPTPQATLAPEPTPELTPEATPVATIEPSVAPPASVAPATPAPSFTLYTVKSNDTLGAIATKFHTTVAAIEKLNNITNPRTLHVGQVLKIPPPA